MSIIRDQPRNIVDDVLGTESSISRYGLKVATFICAIVVIIVEAIEQPFPEGGYVDYIIYGLSAVWCLIITPLQLTRRPPHPGFLIALDLAFTIVMWLFGISSALTFTLYNDYIDLHSPPWVYAVTAFMIITGGFHFLAFVLACVDVHVRRICGAQRSSLHSVPHY